MSNSAIDDVNVINYISNYPSYYDLISNMDKIFGKYSEDIKVLDKEFTNLIFKKIITNDEIELIRNKKKQVLVDVLESMVKWFPQLGTIPVVVYLFGSYGRNSNRQYSDIDLNFAYPDEYFDEMLPIEEIFSICLYRIFNLEGRDKVHAMGCLPLIRNRRIKETTKFSLIFGDGNAIYYEHNRFSLSVMNEIFNMSRSLHNAIDYLNSNNNAHKIIEWNASINLIYNNTGLDFDNFLDISDNVTKLPSFKPRLKAIIDEMCRDFSKKRDIKIRYTEDITISDFKATYKINPFTDIYTILVVLRYILCCENCSVGYLRVDIYLKNENIKNILGERNLKILSDTYYNYYIFMSKVDYVFKTISIELSSHIKTAVCQQFYIQYEKNFGTQFKVDALNNVGKVYQSLFQIGKHLVNYLT